MKDLWAVIGFDAIYEGLHGMHQMAVIEGTEEDAAEYGYEFSCDVINAYPDIYNELEEEINTICLEDDIGFDNEEVIRDEVYNNDIAFDYYRLDKTKLPTLDIDELCEMYYQEEEDFIDKYATI